MKTDFFQIRVLPEHLDPVYIPLPRISIGYVFAVLCLVSDCLGWLFAWVGDSSIQDGFFALGLMVGVLAWLYWLYCMYRIHQILRRASASTYRPAPWLAVLLLEVPFFSWYWRFRVGNQIATFVNTRSALRMKKGWTGAFMMAGSLLGFIAWLPPVQCTSLRWFIFFGVAHHLCRKIRRTVEFREALHLNRQRQIDLAMSAGLGASFAFLLSKGIVAFFHKPPFEKISEGVALLLVSLAAVRFIEPISERLRVTLQPETNHPFPHQADTQRQNPWIVRGILAVMFVFSIFCHEVLHNQLADLEHIWLPLCGALLVSGGVTYFWIAGMRQQPSRAAWMGTISGGLLALFICLMVGTLVDEKRLSQVGKTTSDTVQQVSGQVTQRVAALGQVTDTTPGPITPQDMLYINWSATPFPLMPYGNLRTAWPWAVFGLVGGIIIDRWGRHGTGRVALAIFIAALICEAPLFIWVYKDPLAQRGMLMAANISAVIGWCLGLCLYPHADSVFGQDDAQEQHSRAFSQHG
jgi:hypothetical protein